MILNWYPSPRLSHMQYLSQIALGMILMINQYWYAIQNNLNDCALFQQKWYTSTFDNATIFRLYMIKYFTK
jgi:hypothetical protein